MVWLFLLLFAISFLMGVFDIPQWIFLLVFIPFALTLLYRPYYLVFFEKDVNKIMNFLKKSKQSNYQFIYHLFNDDVTKAEKELLRIRSSQLKIISYLILLSKQKRYNEAKELLQQMKENVHKWYYGAAIALQLGDHSTYQQYKAKVKDPVYRTWLEAEERVHEGKKTEALNMLDEQIPKLRGLKLLSAIQYRKEIREER
ncbi:hypothetical protein C0971_09415 [Bacillus methanolicus]|uniref:hypothetical protein n=1 Tax=Bacillus methanolicus TaxID=1471 RepID=UPI00200DDB2F|nr:hypothetical protein [Bacillus methanolicus]UQD52213.1 hypothetical protein C0971_09415 [Bacillus methanolicus]